MNCLHPVRIGEHSEYPCGKCKVCLKARSAEWALRLRHEAITNKNGSIFLTLTYNEDCIPEDKSLDKKEVQRALKLVRYYTGKQFKYYLAGEYGELKNRPHYHAIIFGLSEDDEEEIAKAWPQGFIDIGTVEPASIRYVTNYILLKDNHPKGRVKPFSLMSKGLGAEWACRNGQQYSENLSIPTPTGEAGLPRYYLKILKVSDYQKNLRKLKLIERREIKFFNEHGREKNWKDGRTYDRYKFIEQQRLNVEAQINLYRSQRDVV